MGVHRKVDKVSGLKAWSVAGIAAVLMVLIDVGRQAANRPITSYWYVVIFVVVWGIYISRKEIYLACPNCNMELLVK